MRICILELQPFPYSIGGGTTHIIDFSKYLIKQGHEVYVITSKPGDNQIRIDTDKNLKVIEVGVPHKIFKKTNLFTTIYSLFSRIKWEIIWVLEAKKVLNKINPDICNPQSLITTSLPCSFSKRKFVATQHGVYLDGFRKLWSERKSKSVLLLSHIYEIIENFNAKRASFITCVGADTYEYYTKFGKDKCKIITHGIDPDKFKNVNLSKKKDYLFMGRLTEQKGVSYLIDAFKILDDEKIKITLNIAGDGDKDYVFALKEKTSKFKYVKVNFLGFVLGNNKFDLYKKSKVFISSSIFEPFGIVLTEAMASGCAMISSNHEGARLLIKPSFGEIVEYKNESERAQNLANAIKHSLKWNIKKMGAEAIKTSKPYSYEMLTKEYIKVFEKI
jgi:glycosyltransferase involved in cell wall biosynthesis